MNTPTEHELDHAARAGISGLLALFKVYEADPVLYKSECAPQLLCATLLMMLDSAAKAGSSQYGAVDMSAVQELVKQHQSKVRAHNSRAEGSS